MGTYHTLELIGNLYEHADQVFAGFTTNGQHVTGSWHYRDGGDAVDFDAQAKKYAVLSGFAAYLYERSSMLVEMFYTHTTGTSGMYVKNGVRQSFAWAKRSGLTTAAESQDHIHVAIATEAQAQRMLTLVTQAALGQFQDGVKGPKTGAAIKAVQKAAKISQDGEVGPVTVKAIRAHKGWTAIPK